MIDITGEIMENPGVKGLGGELPGQVRFGVQGPPGPPGKAFTYDDFTEEQLRALTGQHGKDGLSVYMLNATLGEPEEETFYYRFARSLILTNGRETQVGDLVISNNGILGIIYTFVEDDDADAVIRPMVKLSGEAGALRVDCVITSNLRPPFISLWGENPSINFSVVSGSLTTVWNKINRGEQPNVLFRYIGETEGDVFNYFMEADYVEHFGYGNTPEMLRMNFIGDGEIITLASNNQSDITNNRITSYTVTAGVGQPGKDGDDGITPHIGSNGNWFIGDTDTGKPSRGATGENGTRGTNGYSIYYMNEEVEYPYEGFQTFSVSKENLSNKGLNIKDGDILISTNGVLCNVVSILPYSVTFSPVAKLVEDTEDIVTAVLNALPTWTGGSY